MLYTLPIHTKVHIWDIRTHDSYEHHANYLILQTNKKTITKLSVFRYLLVDVIFEIHSLRPLIWYIISHGNVHDTALRRQ